MCFVAFPNPIGVVILKKFWDPNNSYIEKLNRALIWCSSYLYLDWFQRNRLLWVEYSKKFLQHQRIYFGSFHINADLQLVFNKLWKHESEKELQQRTKPLSGCILTNFILVWSLHLIQMSNLKKLFNLFERKTQPK